MSQIHVLCLSCIKYLYKNPLSCQIPFMKYPFYQNAHIIYTRHVQSHYNITNNIIDSTYNKRVHIHHIYSFVCSIRITQFRIFHTCHNYLSIYLPVSTFTYTHIYIYLLQYLNYLTIFITIRLS